MATGILSIAMRANGWEPVSVSMLGIAVVSYVVLVALNVIRIVRHRTALLQDIADPARAFGFFTFVAGTCVLGSRLAAERFSGAALVLLLIGSVAWIILGYTVPWTAVLGQRRRTALSTANGTWFIWAVGGSQSIAVLAATLEVELTTARPALALLAVFSWSVGTFLYCAVGVFVGVRLLAYPFRPADLTPPYWVAMGRPPSRLSPAPESSRWLRPPRWSTRREAYRRRLGVLLGLRHVAHPAARDGRLLASRAQSDPVALRADVVEHRVPARDVQRRLTVPR